jgi:uncharacterized protein (DUF1800 family)
MMSRTTLLAAALCSCAIGAIAAALHASPDVGEAKPRDRDASTAAPVSFDTSSTIVEVGRSRVIAFRVHAAPALDTSFDAAIVSHGANAPASTTATSNARVEPGRVELLSRPLVLAGQRLGFVRVVGRREGSASLTIGGATLTLRVVQPRSSLADDAATPRITAPLAGACVWGEISVGVEWLDDPHEPRSSPRLRVLPVVSESSSAALDARASSDSTPLLELAPVETSSLSEGPTRRAVFTLDTSRLPDGQVALVPVSTGADAHETLGSRVRVQVIHPQGSQAQAMEAEDLRNWARPARFSRGNALVIDDPAASSGKALACNSSDPPVSWTILPDEPGWYQLMGVFSSDFAGGAHAGVSLYLDNNQNATTWTRTLSRRWHRIPVGIPVRVEPPMTTLTARFDNDFGALRTDRNLRIDRFELVRVDSPGRSAAVSPSADEPGSGSMMMAAASSPPSNASDSPAIMAPSMATSTASTPMSNAGTMSGASMMSGGPDSAPGASGSGWSPGALREADPMGETSAPLRIALRRPVHNRVVTGPVEIDAQCAWPQSDKSEPPVVTMLLNGQPVSRQRSGQPRFWIEPWQLGPGDNTLRLKAESASGDGAVAFTPEQVLRLPTVAVAPGSLPAPAQASRSSTPGKLSWSHRFARFAPSDPAWDDAARASVKPDTNLREQRRLALSASTPLRLRMPSDLAGRFRVFVEARAGGSGPPAFVIARLVASEAEPKPGADAPASPDSDDSTDVGRAPSRAYTDLLALGEINLLAERPRMSAPPSLVLSLERRDQTKGDPQVFVESVILQPIVDGSAGAPIAPFARIVYPALNATDSATDAATASPHEAFLADAIVVEAFHPDGFVSAEALIDDQPTGVVVDLTRASGRIVLPLLLRDTTPGDHRVSVRLTPARARAITTAARTVRVLSAAPEAPTTYELAIRLLDRLGFGPEHDDLGEVLALGQRAWLESRLLRDVSNQSRASDTRAGDTRGSDAALGLGALRFPNRRNEGDVAQRAILGASLDPDSVRARFVLWAQNHFSTWVRKAEADRKWREHLRFARLGVAPFPDLLMASATSPAMLHYLDQTGSFRSRLNENYAREIMELHTLGVHAGYAQSDVTALARVLTGWTVALTAETTPGEGDLRGYEFRFDPLLHDASADTVFGFRLPSIAVPGPTPTSAPRLRANEAFDRVRSAIEMLASHPATARFISRKLVESYLVVPAPDDLVADLASVFSATNGDLAQVLLALATDPRFVELTEQPRLSHPLEFALRLQRAALDARPTNPNPGAINGFLRRVRTAMFDWPTPDGMPAHDAPYADSNAMLQRWRLARELGPQLANLVPNAWRYSSEPPDERWAQRVVDILAVRITGRTLSPQSNASALDVLSKAQGSRDERVREAASFVAATPEASLR